MLTLEQLNNFNNTLDAIQFAESEINKLYVKAPVKPFLAKIHTPDEVIQYAEKLKQYEVDLIEFNDNKIFSEIEKEKAIKILETYIKDEACLHTIPYQYREKVFEIARKKCKSSGYFEVFNFLCELIEIFR